MYVQGNTARKLQAVPSQYERTTIKKDNRAVQKNRDKALHMNVGYVLFLVAAMMMAGLMLTWYLTLQSDITNSIKNVARLESELNSLKLDNDERYSRINSDINLEEVRRVAIQELGMQYAREGQIITYNGEDNDYVRQTGDIPD
ncbi:MAG: cell division protein FtsL [Lachnospiraceae bacterium]|jgi:cell division protein FtsL|nr:cell division protein FtsL [Lachnospiraceae bacterium]MDE6816049.1 cell division protein FtsL [Lachnospiraceae bacterium]MDE6976887.1 cell division protein FtsL [Lachnospiraceae bacterium]